MSTRTVYLVSYRSVPSQRAHFAIWTPYQEGGISGTLIHVTGNPMHGYALEFKRGYKPGETDRLKEVIPIARINAQLIDVWTGAASNDTTPRGNLELVAAQIPPPGSSQNFMAPVNDTTNRRCQEWTMEFIRRLVAVNYLDSAVVDTVQARRDPPNLGIGLQSARNRGAQPVQARQNVQPPQQAPAQQQQSSSVGSGEWIWDAAAQRHRRWNGSEWVWG